MTAALLHHAQRAALTPHPHRQVLAQLRRSQLQAELLVHPNANIYSQLQLEFQDAGLVVSVHSERTQRGESFEYWGIEDGARVSVVVVSVDDLTDDG